MMTESTVPQYQTKVSTRGERFGGTRRQTPLSAVNEQRPQADRSISPQLVYVCMAVVVVLAAVVRYLEQVGMRYVYKTMYHMQGWWEE